MQYVIQSTERTRAKCSEFETKALLYLMNFRKDSAEIYYFVVDFFNDLTGMSRLNHKSWDLQSKAAKNNAQSSIGKELVTLFKNFTSEINFDHYILFLGGVSETIREDKTKNIFNISNITEVSQKKIKEALKKESKKKEYIDNEKITDENIDTFLKELIFVIDERAVSEYVKKIIKVNPKILPSENRLIKIFNQIRDAQSSKKNSLVEGITISDKSDFLFYSRHLTSKEIKMMVFNNLISNNIMQTGIPIYFSPIYNKMPEIERNNILEDCKLDIAKILFDKNNSEHYWAILEEIWEIFQKDKKISIDEAYKKLDIQKLENMNFLNVWSMKYFMSIIREGMYED